MAVGKVEFWNKARGEGAVIAEDGGRFRLMAKNLVGVEQSELAKGLEVVFDATPDGEAVRVRSCLAPFLILEEDLTTDDPLLRTRPCPNGVRSVIDQVLAQSVVNPGLRFDKYLVPAPKQEQQKKRLLDFVRQSCGDFSLCEEAACRREALTEIARGSAMAPEDLRFARSSPRTRFFAGECRNLPPPDLRVCLFARNRAERPGPGVRRDGLAAAPGTGVWHGGNQTRLRTGGRERVGFGYSRFPRGLALCLAEADRRYREQPSQKLLRRQGRTWRLGIARDGVFPGSGQGSGVLVRAGQAKRGDRGGRRGPGP